MPGIRLRENVELASLRDRSDCPSAGRSDRGRTTPSHLVPVMAGLADDGLLNAGVALRDRAVLTLHGRLMADAATRALTWRAQSQSEILVDWGFDLWSKEFWSYFPSGSSAYLQLSSF